MLNGRRYGMGWIPDYPDFRDYTEKTEEVKTLLRVTQLLKKKTLPYEYILKGLAEDFWSVIKKEWVDAGEFNE